MKPLYKLINKYHKDMFKRVLSNVIKHQGLDFIESKTEIAVVIYSTNKRIKKPLFYKTIKNEDILMYLITLDTLVSKIESSVDSKEEKIEKLKEFFK